MSPLNSEFYERKYNQRMKFYGVALALALVGLIPLAQCKCPNKSQEYLSKTESFRKVCEELRSYLVEKKPASGLRPETLGDALREMESWDTLTVVQVNYCEPSAKFVTTLLQFHKELTFRAQKEYEPRSLDYLYKLMRPYPQVEIVNMNPLLTVGNFDNLENLDRMLRRGEPVSEVMLMEGFRDYQAAMNDFEKAPDDAVASNRVGLPKIRYAIDILRILLRFPILHNAVFPKLIERRVDFEQNMNVDEAMKLYDQELNRMGFQRKDGAIGEPEFVHEQFVRELNIDF